MIKNSWLLLVAFAFAAGCATQEPPKPAPPPAPPPAPAPEVKPAPPAQQDFWIDRASGKSAASVDWKVDDGSYRAVVMNADGSLDVAAHGTFGVEVPHVSPIALVLLIAGLVMTAGGIATAVRGARRARRA